MPVDVRETRLPGVGFKYAFHLAHGGRVSVILHMDGQRDIYYYRRATDDERDESMSGLTTHRGDVAHHA